MSIIEFQIEERRRRDLVAAHEEAALKAELRDKGATGEDVKRYTKDFWFFVIERGTSPREARTSTLDIFVDDVEFSTSLADRDQRKALG